MACGVLGKLLIFPTLATSISEPAARDCLKMALRHVPILRFDTVAARILGQQLRPTPM